MARGKAAQGEDWMNCHRVANGILHPVLGTAIIWGLELWGFYPVADFQEGQKKLIVFESLIS